MATATAQEQEPPPPSSSSRLEAWENRGQKINFQGHNVHYFFFEPKDCPPLSDSTGPGRDSLLLVLLHGYPTNSYDWREVIDLLIEGNAPHSILAPDFLGFGLSDKPATGHDYKLAWQADLVEELIARHSCSGSSGASDPRSVFIIAHDMGTSIATELFARDLEGTTTVKDINGALLFNGNMNMALAKLVIGQKALRSRFGHTFARLFSREPIFRWQLGSVFARAHPMTKEQGEDQWKLMERAGGHLIIDKLIQYTFERERLIDRWHGALKNWNKQLFFTWGMEDPVATKAHLAWIKELRGQDKADITELPGLGHYPQLEDPKSFFEVLTSILNKVQ